MKMLSGRICLVVCFLFLVYTNTHAQNADSLLRQIIVMKDDSNKAKLWYELGHIYENGQWDSAAYCYKEARKLSIKLDYTRGRLKYYPNITAVMNANGDYRKGLELNLEGLALSRELHSEEWTGIQLSNTANNYLLMQKWDTAIDYYTQALRILEKRHDRLGIANTYSNMAEIYKYNDKIEKALRYADMAAKLSKGKDDYIYVNALDNKANMLLDMHQYDEAMQTYAEAEKIAMEQGNIRVLTNITGAYMDYYLRKDDYAKLLKYAGDYVLLAQATGSEEFIVRSLYGMARANFFNRNYSVAEKYIIEAKAMAEKTADINMLKKIYPLNANIALLVHNDVKQFHHFITIADSLENVTLNSAIVKNAQELDTKYQTEKKEQQLQLQAARLKQNRLWNVLLTLSVIAVVIIALVSWRSYKNKKRLFVKEQQLQQQRIAVLEQEKLLAASHAVLKGQEEERSRLAKDLHDGLGGLLSSIKFSFGNMKENLVMSPPNQQSFERSMDMLDISIKELRRVAHSMMPESLTKLGLDAALRDICTQIAQSGISKVSYHGIGLENAIIDKDVSVNVYRIVQELLNNAVKHSAATEMVVQVTLRDGVCSLTVEDNGKGFDMKSVDQKNGIGLSNIRSRVGYLNGHLDIHSDEGKGTSVFITFNMQSA